MEREIEKISTLDSDLKEQIIFCCDLLQNLPKYFMAADLIAKQQILGSILAEKMVFQENSDRTIKFRSIISLVCRPRKDYKEKEIKKLRKFGAFQCGAQDWNRTSTPVKAADFESAASTNSATWAIAIRTKGLQCYNILIKRNSMVLKFF